MNTIRSLACTLAGSALGWTLVGTIDTSIQEEGKVSIMLIVGMVCMLWSTIFFVVYMHERDKRLKAILRFKHKSTDDVIAEVELKV